MSYRAPFRARRLIRTTLGNQYTDRYRPTWPRLRNTMPSPTIGGIDVYRLALHLSRSRNLSELESSISEIVHHAMALQERNQTKGAVSSPLGIRDRHGIATTSLRASALLRKLGPLLVRAAMTRPDNSRGPEITEVLTNIYHSLSGPLRMTTPVRRPIDRALGVTRLVASLASEAASMPSVVPPAVAAEVAAKRRKAKRFGSPFRRLGAVQGIGRVSDQSKGNQGGVSTQSMTGGGWDEPGQDNSAIDGHWRRTGNNLIILFSCNRERQPT